MSGFARILPRGWTFEGVGSVRRLAGAVIGIAGLGRIGTAVAERAVAFGMKIIHFGGRPNGRFEGVGSFDELLARSDVLSLHLRLTPATRHLINASALAKAKPGLILINTARGALVDTAALCDALRSGHVAAAGLDVLPTEPPDIADPLVSAWKAGADWIRHKVIITPHAAFYSRAAFDELRASAIRTALSFFDSGELRNCVNGCDLAMDQ